MITGWLTYHFLSARESLGLLSNKKCEVKDVSSIYHYYEILFKDTEKEHLARRM